MQVDCFHKSQFLPITPACAGRSPPSWHISLLFSSPLTLPTQPLSLPFSRKTGRWVFLKITPSSGSAVDSGRGFKRWRAGGGGGGGSSRWKRWPQWLPPQTQLASRQMETFTFGAWCRTPQPHPQPRPEVPPGEDSLHKQTSRGFNITQWWWLFSDPSSAVSCYGYGIWQTLLCASKNIYYF